MRAERSNGQSNDSILAVLRCLHSCSPSLLALTCSSRRRGIVRCLLLAGGVIGRRVVTITIEGATRGERHEEEEEERRGMERGRENEQCERIEEEEGQE